jgi:hypothetical protein
MFLGRIDPSTHLGKHARHPGSAPAADLMDLIQMRRNRSLDRNWEPRGGKIEPSEFFGAPKAKSAGEYRDDDLIAVLTLGDEYMVFVTDDGADAFLFRIIVDVGGISGVLTGNQPCAGELSVARFAANGVMSWMPLPRAIRSTIPQTAAEMGATVLGPVTRTEVCDGAQSLCLILQSGCRGAEQAFGPVCLNLHPPRIGDSLLWHSRRYIWNAGDPSSAGRLGGLAVNDNGEVPGTGSPLDL